MAKHNKKRQAAAARTPPVIWVVLIGMVTIIVAAVLLWRPPGESAAPSANSPQPSPPPALAVRSANLCRRQPVFTSQLGLSSRAVVGTSVRGVVGLAIVDPATGQMYRDPSWGDAGYLGAYVLDGQGNIWTAPAPLTSLEQNPPEAQNKIYKVDTNTGVMTEYIDLPKALPPSTFNPFGVVGLGYDCETNSLYAGSLAGSTPTEEVGRIFRIDLNTGQVADQIDGVDAMGVAVAITPDGKRLFYGLGRSSEVRSVALDEQGNFVGDSRPEFALAMLPGGHNERAQRITFNDKGEMRVKGINFTYSLQVSGQTVPTIYQLRYDTQNHAWEVFDIRKEETTIGGTPAP